MDSSEVDGTYTYALTCGGIESGFASLIVGEPPPLIIGPVILPSGMLGSSYSGRLGASGGDGDYTWFITSGILPPGLTLAAATGAITGVPSEAGTHNFAVHLQDGEDSPMTASASFAITVQPAASKITVQANPATIGIGQNVALVASVAGVQGAQPPGGTVQFTANGKSVGSAATVASGKAALSGPLFTTPGTYSIVAPYSGDANYAAGSSASVQLTVTPPIYPASP